MNTIREELTKLRIVAAVDGDAEGKQVVVTMRDGRGRRAIVEQAIARIGHVVREK